jgi:hypothetical protein
MPPPPGAAATDIRRLALPALGLGTVAQALPFQRSTNPVASGTHRSTAQALPGATSATLEHLVRHRLAVDRDARGRRRRGQGNSCAGRYAAQHVSFSLPEAVTHTTDRVARRFAGPAGFHCGPAVVPAR